jgi:histidinol-phosphate aminotransferase/threonine-phosphate decarboxylase
MTDCIHGALDYGELARLGLQPEEMLDFSVNGNPYGPSPHVSQAIIRASIDRYPDRECLALRRAILDIELAEIDLPLSAVVCGNGSSELIWAIARAYLAPTKKTAIIGPTFGEYLAASHAVGSYVVEFRTQREDDFRPDLSSLSAWLTANRPTLVWLCNPNNPTGTYLKLPEIVFLAKICYEIGALLVIDEAYHHFVFTCDTNGASRSAVQLLSTELQSHILVLRSLTKDYALAGLRLGYAVGSPEVIQRVGAQLPSWNVSGFAQAAGCAALADRDHLRMTLTRLAQERQIFFQALSQLGYCLIPSSTHFCLLEVGDAVRVRQNLLMRKIVVRDCSSFDLSRFIRIATRSADDWQQLIQALEEVL